VAAATVGLAVARAAVAGTAAAMATEAATATTMVAVAKEEQRVARVVARVAMVMAGALVVWMAALAVTVVATMAEARAVAPSIHQGRECHTCLLGAQPRSLGVGPAPRGNRGAGSVRTERSSAQEHWTGSC
jgi:hypothetical protein